MEHMTPEETITALQSLKKHPGYDLLMAWIDEATRGAFNDIMYSNDPTTIMKNVGKVAAYKEVRSRTDFAIDSFISAVKESA